MNRVALPVRGAWLLQSERIADERGAFACLFRASDCLDGARFPVAQFNASTTPQALTLRGLHFQTEPYGEAKLITCVVGEIFDVVADVRPGSPSFGEWAGVRLCGGDAQALLVPQGCAHGFLTLRPGTEVVYVSSAEHAPAHERVLRWDDPSFAIAWPAAPENMSVKDRTAPDFSPA